MPKVVGGFGFLAVFFCKKGVVRAEDIPLLQHRHDRRLVSLLSCVVKDRVAVEVATNHSW